MKSASIQVTVMKKKPDLPEMSYNYTDHHGVFTANATGPMVAEGRQNETLKLTCTLKHGLPEASVSSIDGDGLLLVSSEGQHIAKAV